MNENSVFSTIVEFGGVRLDARKLSREELILLKSKIEEEMRTTKESIRMAIRNKTHFGRQIDLNWKWKATRTLDIYAGYIQMLMLEIRLRKNEKRKNLPFSHFFMLAAEKQIPDKVEDLKRIAREMQRAEKED